MFTTRLLGGDLSISLANPEERRRRMSLTPKWDPILLFLRMFFAKSHPRRRSAPPNGSVPPAWPPAQLNPIFSFSPTFLPKGAHVRHLRHHGVATPPQREILDTPLLLTI